MLLHLAPFEFITGKFMSIGFVRESGLRIIFELSVAALVRSVSLALMQFP
jgi:hypothetical protein